MFHSLDFFAGGVGLAECWPGGRGYVPDARVQVFDYLGPGRRRSFKIDPSIGCDFIYTKNVCAAEIRFYLHRECGAAEMGFYLHKLFEACISLQV